MTNWKAWVGVGTLMFLFGLLALGNAVVTSLAITVVLGTLFAIGGVAQLWAGFSGVLHVNRVFTLLWGLISLLIGVSFIVNPQEGTVSLTMLVTGFLLASGLIRLLMAWRMRESRLFWALLFSGAVTVLLGGYILGNFAAISLSLMGILFGVELLVDGAGLIGFGIFLRNHRL
ncbi:HdeD family acid-resistance protein [Celeribacter sp.]|uniref:HdeD family acid-resistance protein n=1 Tax=Celeribacter sp. TaxID=1890673 RepID=UPI003A8CCCD7